MTVLLICVAYVANVFLNRWLNKVLVKYNSDDYEVIPSSWFWSLIATVIITGIIIGDFKLLKSRSNWFTGKHWKHK